MITIVSSFVLNHLNWPDYQKIYRFDEPLPILTKPDYVFELGLAYSQIEREAVPL